MHDTAGTPPPPVALYTYQLTGTITDAAGKPVAGAVVITRTQDRDFWTFSSATDANGHYSSFFAASDETAADPVTLSVGVALRRHVSYGGNARHEHAVRPAAERRRWTSSSAAAPLHDRASRASYIGAVYEGLVVGISGAGGVMKPLADRWPDAKGNFSMVLPGSARGKTIRFWENQRQFFTRSAARPGGLVDLSSWPTQLGPAAPAGLATLKLPR